MVTLEHVNNSRKENIPWLRHILRYQYPTLIKNLASRYAGRHICLTPQNYTQLSALANVCNVWPKLRNHSTNNKFTYLLLIINNLSQCKRYKLRTYLFTRTSFTILQAPIGLRTGLFLGLLQSIPLFLSRLPLRRLEQLSRSLLKLIVTR